MAIHPNEPYFSQDTLQPGARGETFLVNMPGFRGEEDRVNRTNNHLNCCDHDVPNIKWDLDDRLPVLFRYGFAYGFNQIVTPKGRVMALDPNMSTIDFETKKQHNVLTLANGGVPVRLREVADTYKALEDPADVKGIVSTDASGQAVVHPEKEWAPVIGMDKAYTDYFFRPFAETASAKAQLEDAGYEIDELTGLVMQDGVAVDVRPGNIPVGVLERNEYTRDIDAYNGMMPGPIRTDAMIELPWFLYKDKAEASFWGSAYGNIYPGALVKSDENGRIVSSPLNDPEIVAAMTLGEYEAERRQVVGEVYSATQELVPEGAAKWAVWALEDRLNFDEFNPAVWKATNRRREDNISNSPYASTGEYPGYPFDRAYNDSNLHMLGARLRDGNYNIRMDQEYQYSELGIPGLTDGYNAVVRDIPEERIGEIHVRTNDKLDYIDQIMKVSEVHVVEGSLQVKFGEENAVTAVEGQALDAEGIFVLSYVNEKQGLIKIHVTDAEKADAYLQALGDDVKDQFVTVTAEYKKRGLAGVPTFMDWDGVVGSCKILLTK